MKTWLRAFREVVGNIVVLESPLPITSLARLLQVPQEEITCRLDSLRSILSSPGREDVLVRFLHLSFRSNLGGIVLYRAATRSYRRLP
jgi:hypothetical protein